MVAFCDIIPARAEEAAKTFGAPGAKTYTDYNELLKDETIDVVHVLTPNVAHCPITVAAFEAGKHVMCEKPMAATTEDAQKMLDAWKRAARNSPLAIRTGSVPTPCVSTRPARLAIWAISTWERPMRFAAAPFPHGAYFPTEALQGGGPLIDIGTHALDLTLWCMNNYEVASVSGSVFYKLGHLPEATKGNMFGPWDPETYEVEDSAFGFIKMKNGATIFLEASWALNVRSSREACTTLCGTKAGAEIIGGMSEDDYDLMFNKTCHGKLTEEHFSAEGAVAFFEGASSEPKDLECAQWLDCILNDHDPVVMPEQAFTVTKILDAVYQSAATGKEIRF